MTDSIDSILKRDRWITLSGLLIVQLLAWSYLLSGAGTVMGTDDTLASSIPDARYWLLMFLMWWIMMIAMMLPGATAMVLLASAINRKSSEERPPYGTSASFVGGYLIAWGLFSVLATLTQWGLGVSGNLSPMMKSTSPILSGTLLIAAGLWQLTPIKQGCLRHCQTPIVFLTSRQRSGNLGAIRMGIEHGLYCLGCCWFLMALLFVGGVMSLYWIIGLTAYVLLEKVFPYGQSIAKVVGFVLLLSGSALMLSTAFAVTGNVESLIKK